MAEIEQSALAIVKLILLHNIALDFNTACYCLNSVERWCLQRSVQPGIEYYSVLYHFGTTVAVDICRESVHQLRIATDETRLIECSDKILAGRNVYCSLSSDRAVYGCE